ncbi:MAG: hypothetical protein K2O44_00490 [Clostridia bacterium]|nr:hypothetical protein [Clostridia bacterium]
MQLLVLVLMLMLSGNNTNIKELQPILETIGGQEAAGALKQAEELSGVISAVQSLSAMAQPANGHGKADGADRGACVEEWTKGGYPLAPIANIADERITYCLSRYIALGE